MYRTYTVGTYSPGKLSVVYDINMHVLPTVPSPTTTHLMGLPVDICKIKEFMLDCSSYSVHVTPFYIYYFMVLAVGATMFLQWLYCVILLFVFVTEKNIVHSVRSFVRSSNHSTRFTESGCVSSFPSLCPNEMATVASMQTF